MDRASSNVMSKEYTKHTNTHKNKNKEERDKTIGVLA